MARQIGDFVGRQHFRAATEGLPKLAVVQPRIAARHDQNDGSAGTQRQSLGDLARGNAMGLGGQRDSGRALFQFDDIQVRCMFGEKAPDGFDRHVSPQGFSWLSS